MADVESEIGQEIVEKAKRVLPGGTFGNFAAEVVIREGKGGRVWDEQGKEYIDYLLGSGPMLVGHAHPEVTEAAQAQIAKGTTFFANNRLGIELAEAIIEAVPCAEQVRFVSSGTEADLYAMRAARAFTRRDKILKFEGGFPLAAIAGREEIMAHFDKAKVGDENFLVQIGTLSGNPVAAAAGLAMMAILKRPGAYERIHATGRELMGALGDLLKRAGIAAQVTGEPPLFDVVFTDQPIRDYRSTLSGDTELMRRFNALLRERGILKGESKYYISLAHTDQDIKDTIGIWKDVIAELKQ